MEASLAGVIEDGWFDVTTESPFTAEQAARWPTAPWDVLAEVFPNDIDLLRRHLPAELPSQLSTEHAEKLKQELGYTPQYTFATFVRELRGRERSGDMSAPAGYSVYQG